MERVLNLTLPFTSHQHITNKCSQIIYMKTYICTKSEKIKVSLRLRNLLKIYPQRMFSMCVEMSLCGGVCACGGLCEGVWCVCVCVGVLGWG